MTYSVALFATYKIDSHNFAYEEFLQIIKDLKLRKYQ